MMSSIITIIVPRSLGPSNYGDFSFLNHFFSKVFGFFSFGSLLAFFTKLSQRPTEHKMVRFYVYFLFFVLFSSGLFLSIVYITNYDDLLLNDIKYQIVALSFAYSFLLYIVGIVRQVNDAYGFTVMSEKFFMLQKLLSLGIILILYFYDQLNIVYYFLHLIFVLSFLLIVWVYYLDRQEVKPFVKKNRLDKLSFKNYISEFYKYSHPLFVLGAVSLLIAIAERWLLQYFGGSEQQGFYSFSFAITAIIFLFSGALAPLFTRDFSIAWKDKDYPHMRYLFHRFIPPLIALASFFSFFIAANGKEIGIILGGESYADAGLSLAIMSLYPIHQTYGQLCGSIFYASGKTGLMRNISVPMNIIGFLLAIFLLLPSKYGGINLGSLGLVYKMVFIQVLVVNFYLYHCTKILGISFFEAVKSQIVIMACFSGLAFLSSMINTSIFSNTLVSLIVNGFIYTISAIVLIGLFPKMIISSSRKELLMLMQKVRKKISSNGKS